MRGRIPYLGIALDNGEVVIAEAVLSAIGLKPLTQAAGLRVNRGVAVNRFLETCASDTYAIGDCAEVDGLILPLVQPLVLQVCALAASLTGEKQPVVYPPMPVRVKTSAHPVAVLPPKPGAAGGWRVECTALGVCALHVDETGRLQGFALTGFETGRPTALLKDIEPA